MARSPKSSKQVDALKHDAATRRNIPTAEMESFFRRDEDSSPREPKHYPRTRPLAKGQTRTAEEPSQPELIWNGARITITDAQMAELAQTGTLTLSDAQLVWRGKDRQDWSDLVVNVPPLYIQEKIHPKAIIDDLKRRTAEKRKAKTDAPDLFADFNGLDPEQRAEFYQHDQHWSNRMILGDSLQVMASLSERESLKGKVQCIYFDPPYGIKFNSNWQVSTQSRDVKDGKQTDISREPEQVKAFRDTWKDGIHSYLTYLRDRMTAMRDLLTESGSIFVQIGDENVHRVRAVMDEVFGAENFVSEILIKKKGSQTSNRLEAVNDFLLWYAKSRESVKVRNLFEVRVGEEIFDDFPYIELEDGVRISVSDLGEHEGKTAYVAQQWGRRWITIDTSRVALALARTRLMAARYLWYLLADSREGRAKETELIQRVPADGPVNNDIRQGFVYERFTRQTSGSIANNPLIDDISEKWQAGLEPLRAALNAALDKAYEEWQVPRELPAGAPATAKEPHAKWWEARIARQREIDASIAARADVEYLYDRPYIDNARIRVAGPFTVESLSPHRVLPASEAELIGEIDAAEGRRSPADADLAGQDFAAIVIDYLKAEGVKQQAKGDRITFESLTPWPGNFVGASGIFIEGENGPERRAAILIGPEYGTVGRQDLVAAAREAVDARFDVLIACAFNFDAHSSELGNLGSLTILKARINPDMHMSDELKNTGRGNMFVVFGEPDVEILDDGGPEIRVKVNGVDVFDPNTGDIRSNDTAGIAAWFIDTNYNEESFFVRHAYFLGANDPYKSLKTALQAEIDEDAWATLYSDTSRPFARPARGRIAVKVINHFGDEVMKVFGV